MLIHVYLQRSNNNNKKDNSKGNNAEKQWSREWDEGKTSADDWKMNVPDIGDRNNHYFKIESTENRRGRGGKTATRGDTQRVPGMRNPGYFHDDRSGKSQSSRGRGGRGTFTKRGGHQGSNDRVSQESEVFK